MNFYLELGLISNTTHIYTNISESGGGKQIKKQNPQVQNTFGSQAAFQI